MAVGVTVEITGTWGCDVGDCELGRINGHTTVPGGNAPTSGDDEVIGWWDVYIRRA